MSDTLPRRLLSIFEKKLSEHLETLVRLDGDKKVVPDLKFTFSYQDPRVSEPYVFEYKGQ